MSENLGYQRAATDDEIRQNYAERQLAAQRPHQPLEYDDYYQPEQGYEYPQKSHKVRAMFVVVGLLAGVYGGYDNVLNGGKEAKALAQMAGFGGEAAIAPAPMSPIRVVGKPPKLPIPRQRK